jgi:hypothetical protein
MTPAGKVSECGFASTPETHSAVAAATISPAVTNDFMGYPPNIKPKTGKPHLRNQI